MGACGVGACGFLALMTTTLRNYQKSLMSITQVNGSVEPTRGKRHEACKPMPAAAMATTERSDSEASHRAPFTPHGFISLALINKLKTEERDRTQE